MTSALSTFIEMPGVPVEEKIRCRNFMAQSKNLIILAKWRSLQSLGENEGECERVRALLKTDFSDNPDLNQKLSSTTWIWQYNK
jgi:hypothetical protein